LPLVFARCLAFVLLKENRAVSADEKKPDKKSNTVNTITWSSIIKINLKKNIVGEAVLCDKRVLQLFVKYKRLLIFLAKRILPCNMALNDNSTYNITRFSFFQVKKVR
jgi:hypothetical protein